MTRRATGFDRFIIVLTSLFLLAACGSSTGTQEEESTDPTPTPTATPTSDEGSDYPLTNLERHARITASSEVDSRADT